MAWDRQLDSASFLRRPAYLMFLVFLFASMFLNGQGQLRAIGIVLGLFFLYSQTNQLLKVNPTQVPGGIWSYIMWITFALVTGPAVAKSPPVFWGGMKAAIQSVILVYIVYCVTVRRRTCKEVWAVFVVAVIIHMCAVYLGYDMAAERSTVENASNNELGHRISGLAGNENGLGDFTYLGVFAAFMLWTSSKGIRRAIIRIFLMLFVCASVAVGFKTGSRQTAVIMLCMVLSWLMIALPILCNNPGLRFFVRVVSIIGIVCASATVVAYVLTETTVGARFKEMMDTRAGVSSRDGSMLVRMYLYDIGMEIFREHPFAGVGFNQFIVHNPLGLFSHSDYIEPLACTGGIGFLLYHGFALGALFQVLRLFRFRVLMTSEEKYFCRMLLIYIGLHYLSGVFSPHWYKLQKVMVVALIYAVADSMRQDLRLRRKYMW